MRGVFRRFALGFLMLAATVGVMSPSSAMQDPASSEVAGPGDVGYRLGAGDRVRIIVFGEQTLSGEYVVTGSGNVSFPLIGNVEAKGRPIEDLQDSIRTKLADGYIKDPRVSVEVLNYRPYYILGEVTRPGEYPYSVGLTVQQAVASAGGFTYRANEKKVFIKRALDAVEKPVEIRGKAPVSVQPGDTIRVGERYF